MQEAKINLGKVVRIARKRKRITQDYLAEKVGVQPRTILEIENGRGNPRFENLFVMVRLLDIAPNDIFNYDCGLAQDTEQLFQELSSFSEEEQRMAAAAARAVLQQIRYEKEHCKEEVSNKTNGWEKVNASPSRFAWWLIAASIFTWSFRTASLTHQNAIYKTLLCLLLYLLRWSPPILDASRKVIAFSFIFKRLPSTDQS